MSRRMAASLVQLAWYLERDGASIAHHHADGGQRVRVPLAGGHIDYEVPAHLVAQLNRERDLVYRQLAERRRKVAR
jgi:hypothetical protein